MGLVRYLIIWGLGLLHATRAISSGDDLRLGGGIVSFSTPAFTLALVNSSQTAFSLRPVSSSGLNNVFDFLPYDVMANRSSNGQHHLGDITYRVRYTNSTSARWISGDSATARKPVTPIAITDHDTLAAADLTPTLPSNSPLRIVRRWSTKGGVLQLLFDVQNIDKTSVEIGALGVPLEFNNIFTDRTAENTNENCSLYDPYIGLDAGYVQVTPLLGTLPPLVVTPAPSTSSPLEGWRFLPENGNAWPYYQSQTFEGIYEWSFHTLAYAQQDGWKQPWNTPSSIILVANQTRTYGLTFHLATGGIREIENTLANEAKRPVAVGLPGYIVPRDQVAKLFLRYGSKVKSLSVEPSNALSWKANSNAINKSWVGYDITPSAGGWGRARLTITYSDGVRQAVHYYVTKPSLTVLSDLGSFLTTEQWYDGTDDPFGRQPSIISYDRSVNQKLLNEPRVWISGLSDEGGTGAYLAAVLKTLVSPVKEEVDKIRSFVEKTLWGTVQISEEGETQYGVKRSAFFYEPSLVPNWTYPGAPDEWSAWWSYNKATASVLDRGYNYVHVVSTYWSIYRVLRNYPSLSNSTTPISSSNGTYVTTGTWQWYLLQAYNTVLFMTDNCAVGYLDVGLMGETTFLSLLSDLGKEGFTTEASEMELRMKERQELWADQRYPYGSEMAWDSTGQEGVYAWSKHFGDNSTATNVINSILAFQPTVPHWGYNGNARRYWDNIYAGKLERIERQIHHYGSGLNALPLISEYESNPTDYYLLRVAYGGLSGPLSNIDEEGFASASFHSFEDTLAWDAYSGDYGQNFVGLALRIGTYLIQHPDFGWQALGGTILSSNSTVAVKVLDPVRRKIFVAPIATTFELEAGIFDSFTYNPSTKEVKLVMLDGPAKEDVRKGSEVVSAQNALLLVKQTAIVTGVSGTMKPTGGIQKQRDAWVIDFTKGGGRAVATFQF